MGINQLTYVWTAVFPIAVLLYYFFRKKYVKKSVSTTLFWQEAMKETKASPYLQHLQRNALFYLQMLAMLLLVLALIQPYWKTKAIVGEQIVFIVDTSATMNVNTNNSTPLFEEHKDKMLQLVEQLSGKPLTLITTGNEPTVLLRQEMNTEQMIKEINKLEINYETENMSKSLDFAQSFFQNKATSVYVFTDKLDRKNLPLQYENVSWNIEALESNSTNISIKRFGATETANGISTLIQLENQSDKETNTELTISNEEKKLVSEIVKLPPKETITLSFDELKNSSYLRASIDIKDSYQLDNEIIVFMQEQLSNVFIDSSIHSLVRTAFQSLDINVSSVPSEQVGLIKEEGIIVTNQFGIEDYSERPTLYIGRNDTSPKEVNGIVHTTESPLFAFADLSDIYVSSVYPPVDDYTTIASVGEDPFIQISPSGDILILSDIQMTDWPLSPTFPLFMWSVKEHLSAGSDYIGTFTPNERKALSLGATEEWEIYTMNDEYEYTIENGGKFLAPSKPGLYVLRSNDVEKNLSVILSQEEKVVDKGTSYKVSGQQMEVNDEHQAHSFVPYILMLLVLLFVIEWEVQRRRGFTS
ncbi:von Willebrand factor type A domain-containing protein [Psychrobacillus sp. OK028]|uniref:vWA domain-containing protein n=1 Tax=Psychrobacillus sp. OK028 TaxID=1884359 RepID=UPI00088638E4|nr:VWA domain-containing protein [Psychrobacillus sp. OK028]SDM48692.1 von Willebrand factor type A domain-containing protein [Psychrobacillus sp. OK028]